MAGILMYIVVVVYNSCVPQGTAVNNRKEGNMIEEITSISDRVSQIITPKSLNNQDDAFFRTC